LETLVDKHEFKVNHLYNYEGIDIAFNQGVDALNGRMNKVMAEFNELNEELGQLRAGLRNTPGASMEDLSTARSLDVQLKEVGVLLKGDATRSKREFETAPSAQDAVGLLAWGAFNHRGAPTGTMKQLKEDAEAMLADAEKALAEIDEAMDALEAKAVEQGVPFWD
jgi:hypothetical protein